MTTKAKIFLFSIFILIALNFAFLLEAAADEGMWPISKVKELIADSLKKYDFKLTSDDFYSAKNPSIKDAIVIFGKGCTGEMVSEQGLLFTNHHCGYSAIQSLSTIEHNLLNDGFWSKNKEQELPVADLTVSFLKRFDDITDTVLKRIPSSMEPKAREKLINKITDSIAKVAKENDKYEVEIKECFSGLQYFMVVYQVFKDIRLVGVPPVSIGKFGGDTDNWMWPRHSGDFSVFRVYADSSGNPAKYSVYNIPLKPRKYLSISLKGFAENDPALVIGYPGSTNRYSTSSEVDELRYAVNEPRIVMRNLRLDILGKQMRDSVINLKYAAKYTSSSNYYKYSIGQNSSFDHLSVLERKRNKELAFKSWVNSDTSRIKKFGKCLSQIDSLIKARSGYYKAVQYYSEAFYRNIELYSFVRQFIALVDELKSPKSDSAKISKSYQNMLSEISRFYKNFDINVDKAIVIKSVEVFSAKVEAQYKFPLLQSWENSGLSSIEKHLNKIYKKTIFGDSVKVKLALIRRDFQLIEKDPMVVFSTEILSKYRDIYALYSANRVKIKIEQRNYIEALLTMSPTKVPYPDANGSMRLSYGKIKGYSPQDAVYMDFKTTLDGLIAKEDTSKNDFKVNEKLKRLFLEKTFDQYGPDEVMPVDFISTNDNTGGNSGSPVLNKNGEIIGIAFDGNWEAMSRDVLYEPELQRAISVDIRYVLFLIDKFGNAGYLLKELDIKK
jgi:uncharacterized protein (UPF0305 family)